jgi:phosphoglycolate phosphatase
MADPIIVFDLDGTLVDTAPDLIASLNHTIAAASLEPVGYEDLTHLVGHGARAMIERAFTLRQAQLSPAELDRMMARFIEHYGANMPGDSKVFPGLVEALTRLSAKGYRLAVCTNKMERFAVTLIDKLGLAPHFQAIAGGDTFSMRKPDPRHLTETIARAGGDPQRAVMVGDSINDILAARNAGIACIAVPFGYSDPPVETLGADVLITHFDQLTPELAARLIDQKRAGAA